MKFSVALAAALAGEEPTLAGASALLSARGEQLEAMGQAADKMRKAQVGEVVTYVVNRNINFTNVCIKRCHFCAFSDDLRGGKGYFLPLDEIIRRAEQARAMGATEICVQAGLVPELDAPGYLRITESLKTACPELHLHAWSPEEIKHGARQSRITVRDFLADLKRAGLDSIPGTSAEILDDSIRKRLAVGRITSAQWLDVIRHAHELGLPSTSTMMFGHLESAVDQAGHLLTLRRLQQQTGGFTEFVPLAFVHHQAPLFSSNPDVRPGPCADERRAVYAASRLLLGDCIPNLQVSWVKEGLQASQKLLAYGVNDVGGTLVNESISTAAGAPHGQMQAPAQLLDLIAGSGRPAQQRDTLYRPISSAASRPWDEDYGDWQRLRDEPDFAYGASGNPSRSAAVSTSQAKP
jgi:7,8-didemethyl-8-hydroxy-5-deazariboflavin synthase CofH subunit